MYEYESYIRYSIKYDDSPHNYERVALQSRFSFVASSGANSNRPDLERSYWYTAMQLPSPVLQLVSAADREQPLEQRFPVAGARQACAGGEKSSE